MDEFYQMIGDNIVSGPQPSISAFQQPFPRPFDQQQVTGALAESRYI